MTSGASAAPARAPSPGLAFVWLASAAVLAATLLASFRLGFAEDLATLLRDFGAPRAR